MKRTRGSSKRRRVSRRQHGISSSRSKRKLRSRRKRSSGRSRGRIGG